MYMEKNEWDNLTEEKKKDIFLWKMTWFHQEKSMTNSSSAISSLSEKIEKASESSERLTRSIRNATWIASIIGGLALVLSFVKMF
jgi:hypothetical protein